MGQARETHRAFKFVGSSVLTPGTTLPSSLERFKVSKASCNNGKVAHFFVLGLCNLSYGSPLRSLVPLQWADDIDGQEPLCFAT